MDLARLPQALRYSPAGGPHQTPHLTSTSPHCHLATLQHARTLQVRLCKMLLNLATLTGLHNLEFLDFKKPFLGA